ncbi:hypothetical protein ABTF38_09965, partial [Acinetobacter baumannii]
MSACPVCGGEVDVRRHVCAVSPYQGKVMDGHHCLSCGLVRFPDNQGDYVEVQLDGASEKALCKLRNASDERPGREFHMAEMGLEILGRQEAAVTHFGSGLNTDWQWVRRGYPQVRTKLVDLRNRQDVADFETIEEATPSDIVIASE